MLRLIRFAAAACVMLLPGVGQADMLGFDEGVLVFPNLTVVGRDEQGTLHFVGDIEVYPDADISDEGEILVAKGTDAEVRRRCIHIRVSSDDVSLQERMPCDVHVLPRWLDDDPGWEVHETQLREVRQLFDDALPQVSAPAAQRLVRDGEIPRNCDVALDWVARSNGMVPLTIDTAPLAYNDTVAIRFDLTEGSALLQQGTSIQDGTRLTHYRLSVCGA